MESDDGDIIEDFKKLKVENLKRILLENGEPTTGKKADLVLRCEVLTKRKELQSSQNEVYQASATPSQDIRDMRTGEITFKVIAKEAEACEWSTDLRHLPSLSFVQLYDYLVVVTSQFDHEQFKKSGGFKKLKSFKFFKEGHLKHMSCGTLRERTYVKCQVLASMKKQRYNVIVSFDNNGNVLKAACECVAGKGVYGFGKCNHVGGMLFAIEDFCRQGLKNNPQPVSCTSKLCQWNVPRNLKVDPKPVDDILIVKHQYGKESAKFSKNSLYDPRAPSDREMNNESLQQFCSTLASCLKSSSFFLFYDLQPSFSDDYDISSEPFKEMLDIYKESDPGSDVCLQITMG